MNRICADVLGTQLEFEHFRTHCTSNQIVPLDFEQYRNLTKTALKRVLFEVE